MAAFAQMEDFQCIGVTKDGYEEWGGVRAPVVGRELECNVYPDRWISSGYIVLIEDTVRICTWHTVDAYSQSTFRCPLPVENNNNRCPQVAACCVLRPVT